VFLTALVRAALLPPVVAALDEPQQASSALRSSISLEALKLGLAGGARDGAAPRPRDLAHIIWRASVRSSLPHFLAGTLG
jgi:hypothetical protein